MSTRTVLVLFAIAAGLSVYARIFEQGAAPWLKRGRLFPDLEPGDIVEMHIARKELEPDADRGVDIRPIRLRYEGTPPAWWLVEPIRFIAYHPRVQSIAYDLTEVASVAEVAPEDAARRSAEGQVMVHFKTRKGDEHSIEILEDHPVPAFDFSYVRVNDETFAIPSRFRKRLSVSLGELRSRALVEVSSTDAVKVEIGGGEKFSRTLERDGDSAPWRLVEPINALADRRLTHDLLVALNSWAISHFVTDAAEDLAEYGLDDPRATVRVDAMDGRSFALEIGSEVTETREEERDTQRETAEVLEPMVYLRHAGRPSVYTASTKPLENIRENVDAFRSRYLFELGLEEIREIRGEMDGNAILLKSVAGANREGQDAGGNSAELSWKVRSLPSLEAPGEEPGDAWLYVDRARIQSVLLSLRRLLIQKFLSEALDSPRGTFDLHVSDGRKIEVRIGPLSTEPGDEGQSIYQVAVVGEPGSFLVSMSLPAMLEKGTDAFRSREISDLDLSRPREIEMEIRDGEESWVLGRLEANSWLLSRDTPLRAGKQLDASVVEGFVLLLSEDRFRVKDFRSDIKDYSAHRLELQNPRREARFRDLGSDSRFRKLLLGDPFEDSRPFEVPARVGDPEIPPFLLEAEVVKAFDSLVRHLREITGA